MKTSIYKITNNINNKSYIGVSNNPSVRFRSHKSEKTGSYISRAINKHGLENFSFEIIEEHTNRMDALKREIELIKTHNSIRPNGYNISPGGDNPPCKTGNQHHNYGKKLTEKEKENLRNKNLGKKHSLDTKLKKARVPVDVIENIHILHKEAGTMQELSKRLGIGIDTVRNYISGNRFPEIKRKGEPFIKAKSIDNRTSEEKERDRRKKISESSRGEKSSSAKLNNDTVHKICKILKNKKDGIERISNKQIAEMYGCKKGTIEQISSGRQWSHISKNYF